MAYRQIHTELWDDDWVLDLGPLEKLFFVYLFSNGRTHMIGLYELSWKKAAFETGLDGDTIQGILQKFEAADKVKTSGSWVWVKNLFVRNCNNIRSPQVQKSVESALAAIPNTCPLKIPWLEHYNRTIAPQYGISPISYDTDTSSGHRDTTSGHTDTTSSPMDTTSADQNRSEADRKQEQERKGAHAPPPPPKADDKPPPTEHQAMFTALAQAYRINLDTLTQKQRGRLNADSKRAREAGITLAQVRAADDHWWRVDWRGVNKRSPPTTSQFFQTVETVTQAMQEDELRELETW